KTAIRTISNTDGKIKGIHVFMYVEKRITTNPLSFFYLTRYETHTQYKEPLQFPYRRHMPDIWGNLPEQHRPRRIQHETRRLLDQ
ncbi:MAG: hypothetical protein JXN60_05880, partial [Lentisphaerae bacterium]|nr:hypothetical protein [Lentisphaerota bacterium]